ncbi:MAG: nitroreductase family protein [Bacteroidales bacterium]|jgi:nitroreductase|nr:nitroreductase family protein [Bacteroidales bacterium]
MSIIEVIQQRRSVRTYTGESLSQEHVERIEKYISQLQSPFGVKARIQLIHTNANDPQPIKLGTYGWVSGAKDYLALIYEEGTLAETGAACIFEQLILYCTELGLGTCWLGGSFNRKDFKRQIKLQSDEKLRIVSPVGYPGNKKRFIESFVVKADKNHHTRKPFEANFFYKDFSVPLTKQDAAIYSLPLEMVRLAPSANNTQPWRILFDDGLTHFYRTFSFGFSAIDIGIALCHFWETCKEMNIDGHFEILDRPNQKDFRYTISWINEKPLY